MDQNKDKVCLIALCNIYLLPYSKIYTMNAVVDFIFWDRHGQNDEVGLEYSKPFKYSMPEESSKFKKLIGYIKFSLFARKEIKKNNYTKLVFMQTSAGIVLLPLLLFRFRKKYIVEIRDYTHEKKWPFSYLSKKLTSNSYCNIISSKGYLNFLPKNGNYVVCHNDRNLDEEIVRRFRSKSKNANKLVLTYIGLIRFHEQNLKIIETFGNDERYHIQFIGAHALYLEEFVNLNKIRNVTLIDKFNPEDTYNLLEGTHCILNLYGNNTPLLDYALSNKLYYSAKLMMPILVCPDTYMEKISHDYNIGITVDLDDDKETVKLHVFNSYMNMDWNKFRIKSDEFMDLVKLQNDNYYRVLESFLGVKVT